MIKKNYLLKIKKLTILIILFKNFDNLMLILLFLN